MPSLPVEATQVPGLRGGKVVSRCPAIGSSRGPPAVKTRRGSKNLVRPPTENPEEPLFWLFRLFSGWRGEIQPAAVEVDGVDEVLFVAEATGRVLHPLDLGVDGFARGVGDAVLEVGDDVGEAAFQHAGHFLYRSQTAAHRPTVPPLEVLPRRAFIDVGVQVHGGLLQGPGAGRLQFAVA